MEKITPLPLSEMARVKTALGADFEIVQQQVRQGAAVLVECNRCALVLRKEIDTLVIVAAEGENATAVMRTLIEIAKRQGLTAVRFHTIRKGLARLLREFNPEPTEYIYKVSV